MKITNKIKRRAEPNKLAQKIAHQTTLSIIDVVMRMYAAEKEKENCMTLEEYLQHLQKTTPKEFYELPIKEKK